MSLREFFTYKINAIVVDHIKNFKRVNFNAGCEFLIILRDENSLKSYQC